MYKFENKNSKNNFCKLEKIPLSHLEINLNNLINEVQMLLLKRKFKNLAYLSLETTVKFIRVQYFKVDKIKFINPAKHNGFLTFFW